MVKRRISTTISQKHWEILKKHAEKFETQQKALEAAIERLETETKSAKPLSLEEQLRIRWCIEGGKATCVVGKDLYTELIKTADIDRIKGLLEKFGIFLIEWYLQKPLKKCSLREIINAVVINTNASNWYETVNYTDDGDYYTLKILVHSPNINLSKIDKIMLEGLFREYGAKIDCEMSECSLFVKIYKNQ